MNTNTVVSLIKEICESIIGVVDKYIVSESYDLRPEFFQNNPVEHERDGNQLDWSSDNDESVGEEKPLGAPQQDPCATAQPGFMNTDVPGFLPDEPQAPPEDDGYCEYCGCEDCYGECEQY